MTDTSRIAAAFRAAANAALARQPDPRANLVSAALREVGDRAKNLPEREAEWSAAVAALLRGLVTDQIETDAEAAQGEIEELRRQRDGLLAELAAAREGCEIASRLIRKHQARDEAAQPVVRAWRRLRHKISIHPELADALDEQLRAHEETSRG